MTFIRIIGDVHGAINTPCYRHNGRSYLDIIKDASYSVQLGDMGFNYSGLDGVDPLKHVFIPGNHDNYDALTSHALNDYGLSVGLWQFFHVRGAWSIDIKRRHAYDAARGTKTWWPQEELSLYQMEECLESYKTFEPDVVLTHDCPQSIAEQVGNPGIWSFFGWDGPRTSNTQLLLQEMFEVHQPKLWLYGHYHRNWTHIEDGTTFKCIDELDYIDFNENWEII